MIHAAFLLTFATLKRNSSEHLGDSLKQPQMDDYHPENYFKLG